MKRKQIKEADNLSLFPLFDDIKKIIYLSIYLFYCICQLLRDEKTIPTSLDDIRGITFEDENKEIVVALLTCKYKKIEVLALDKTRAPRTIVLGIHYEMLPHLKITEILIE